MSDKEDVDLKAFLAVNKMLMMPSGRHIYISTSCLHGHHGYCKNERGLAGDKRPGHCKFCNAVCVCPVCKHSQHDSNTLNSETSQ